MDQSQPDDKLSKLLERQPDRDAVCPEHGPYISKHLIGSRFSACPHCAEVERRQRKEEERLKDDGMERDRLNARLLLSGLVGRFESAEFENFVADTAEKIRAKTACREFVEAIDPRNRKGGGLWLVGPPGTGKTHLGSAMVNFVCRDKKSRSAIYSAREIVRLIRSTWGNRDRGRSWNDMPTTEDEMIEHLGSMALLVLDEVGVGFGSDAENVQLFDVLDLRYRKQVPTVILSNLPASELKTALGDRAYDRMREGAVLIPCKWESRRNSGSRND